MAYNGKRLIVYLISIVVLVIILTVAFFIGMIIAHFEIVPETETTLMECFTAQVNMPYYPDIYTLGTIIDDELFLKILKCENLTGNPTLCNQEFGCGSGIGDGQLTAIAIKDCEIGLRKKINPYNPNDNMECSVWLYKEYGTAPWGCEECEWGSWDCWSQYLEK